MAPQALGQGLGPAASEVVGQCVQLPAFPAVGRGRRRRAPKSDPRPRPSSSTGQAATAASSGRPAARAASPSSPTEAKRAKRCALSATSAGTPRRRSSPWCGSGQAPALSRLIGARAGRGRSPHPGAAGPPAQVPPGQPVERLYRVPPQRLFAGRGSATNPGRRRRRNWSRRPSPGEPPSRRLPPRTAPGPLRRQFMGPKSSHPVDDLVSQLAGQELVVQRVLGHQVREALPHGQAGNSAGHRASSASSPAREELSIERASSLRA